MVSSVMVVEWTRELTNMGDVREVKQPEFSDFIGCGRVLSWRNSQVFRLEKLIGLWRRSLTWKILEDIVEKSRVEYIEYKVVYMLITSDNIGALEIPLIWADGVHQYLDGNRWEFMRAFWEKFEKWREKSAGIRS